ncbi:DUF1272 domain-containing protein [Maribacter sp. 2307UL18-2]|uniref:DUF1272 domain-containing protein n=1 Tax=Maribacter sp. 2307UL18-2 TaxID=3386274 RepID=UPI0039BCE40E
MLAIRPNCEQCGTSLPNTSTEAMICSFECTYCKDCVTLFEDVCPSCGGNFHPRPIRPGVMVVKYPVSQKRVYQPKDTTVIQKMKDEYANLKPEIR